MFDWNLLVFLWILVAGIVFGFGFAIGNALWAAIRKS